MNVFQELRSEEVSSLRKRYFELFGVHSGYHWEEYGSIEDYKAALRKRISEKELELQKNQTE